MMRRLGARAALVTSLALSAAATLSGTAAFAAEHWIATWAASPHHIVTFFRNGSLTTPLRDQTVRQRIHVSVGGSSFRVRFSNAFGSGPLVIGAASIALPDRGAAVEADSLRQLTFGGAVSIRVPPGAPALSDPIALAVL